jgi:hypothetical protein
MVGLMAFSLVLPLLHYKFLWDLKGTRWFAELGFYFPVVLLAALVCSFWQPRWTHRLSIASVFGFMMFTFIYACYALLVFSMLTVLSVSHAA